MEQHAAYIIRNNYKEETTAALSLHYNYVVVSFPLLIVTESPEDRAVSISSAHSLVVCEVNENVVEELGYQPVWHY